MQRAGSKLGIWVAAPYMDLSFSEDTIKKSVDWFSQHYYQETPEVQVQAQIYNVRDICITLLNLSYKVSPVLRGGETLET